MKATKTITRREFVAATSTVTAALLTGTIPAIEAMGEEKIMKKTFSILHTNDMHSAFIGMGPSSDYSPFTLNDDATRGGFARLAGMITSRKAALQKNGPVLLLDAGDYSMGTPFGAASRETGSELQIMSRMGYDATTFGNHDFDLGPEGLAASINVAAKAGHIPTIVAANTGVEEVDPTLATLQGVVKAGFIRRYTVIERGGIKFGIFGVIGKEAIFYTTNSGAIKFADFVTTAKEIVASLRDKEKVDVVIALSHGGVMKDKDGGYTDGDDVRLAREVPGIDVIVGGHSHTELQRPIIVNGHTPVVQTGKEGANLGELTISIDGDKLTVDAYQLHPIDDTVMGDHAVGDEIENLKKQVTAAVFASRGFGIDQPLAIAPRDIPNTFTDIEASTILANLATDAFRKATGADIGLNVNGMTRAPILRGKKGVVTVYDVFAVAPLGAGIVDQTAGSALVTAHFTAGEIKNILEFFLVDNPAHPGEYFPRVSGMRFKYDKSRPTFDVVTTIEMGDLDRGYTAVDFSENNKKLYSVTCSLYLGLVLIAIPKYSKGKLPLVPKSKEGKTLTTRIEALDSPGDSSTPYVLPPKGKMDSASVATGRGNGGAHEIKEWQAIMDHLRNLPAKKGELPVIPVDDRAEEMRAIKVG